jgi:WD40 repeat protein/tetratricopeptide (TPR) repeat protein
MVAALTTEGPAQSPAYFRTVARLGIQAAEALEHAHQLGVVHRDVKPGNLLLDGRGNLWVTDFGLARLPNDPGLTMTGDLIGTLRYMSPEQALAKRVVIDHRTDVYSLAATLYELLALRPVFDGNDRQELLRQIAFEEPRPPRRWNKAIPTELQTIVLKALEKNPAERYATAQELADDLRRFLEDKPIRAKRPSLAQRAAKWVRRHPSAVRATWILLGVTLVVLIASLVLIAGERERADKAYHNELTQRQRADKAYHNELTQRRVAEKENENGEQLLYLARMNLAHQAFLSGMVERTRELLGPYLPHSDRPDRRGWVGQLLAIFGAQADLPHSDRPDRRGWEWHFLDGVCRGDLLTLGGPQGLLPEHRALLLAWSPDGRWLATGGGRFLGINNAKIKEPGLVQIWDPVNGHEVHRLKGHPWFVFALAWSPDAKRLATGCIHGEVKIWDAATGQQLRALPRQKDGGILGLKWSPNGQYLAAWAGHVLVWNTATGAEVLRVPQAKGMYHYDCCWSPDSTRLAVAVSLSLEKKRTFPITLWNVRERKAAVIMTGHRAGVYALALSPDGKHLASASWDRTVRLWEATAGREVRSLAIGRMEAINLPGPQLGWSPDGKHLAALDAGRNVYLWTDVVRQANLLRLRGHTARISALTWSPDSRRLASSSQDQIIRLWDLTGQEVFALRGHTSPVAAVAWSPDGQRLASLAGLQGEANDNVKIWDAAGAPGLVHLWGHRHSVLGVSWRPDGRRLASSGGDGQVRVWDPVARRTLFTLPSAGQSHIYEGVAWSPDGRRLALPGPDNRLTVWDLEDRRQPRTGPWLGDSGLNYAVAWSPDGQKVAYSGRSSQVRISYPTAKGGRTLILQAPPRKDPSKERVSEIYKVGWSQNGRYVAGLGFYAVYVWDPNTGRCLAVRDSAKDSEHVLAWSPRASLLAYKGPGNSIVVWNVESEAIEHELRGLGNPLCVAWSPDGRRIAAGYPDGHITFWDLATGQEALTQVSAHAAEVNDLAWSPDGMFLATACNDGSVGVLGTRPVRDRGVMLAEANTRLAWSLATGSDARLRNPRLAIELAHRLLDTPAGREGRDRRWIWLALGAAQYRAGNPRAATAALEQVIQLGGDDGFADFFLALAHADLGDAALARKRFEGGVRWMNQNRPWDEPLRRVRAETAARLGLRDRPPKVPPKFGPMIDFPTAKVEIDWERPDEVIAAARDAVRKNANSAGVHDHLAWLLATCPDPKFRHPGEAVRLAKRAVQLDPKAGANWNTLGVAHYRAGEWRAAFAALTKSMELGKGGEALDWFFLAMVHWHLGAKEQARTWYGKAVHWMDRYDPRDDELRRFRAEAAALLGIKDPPRQKGKEVSPRNK